MPRQPLAIGHHGKISRKQQPSGLWRASCRHRDDDGATRQVTATGRTGAAAERRLLRSLDTRGAAGSAELTSESRIRDLAPIWWEEFTDRDRAVNTRIRYKDILDRIVLPGIGAWQIHEARVSRLNRFMKKVRDDHGATTAKLMKAVLFGLLSVAVANDVIEANPMREVQQVRITPKAVRALTVEEVAELRAGLTDWQQHTGKAGRPRPNDLLDVIDIMLATGCRIGEALAIRWEDVDLGAEHPTVTIQGTVVYVPHEGVIWQKHPKSAGSQLTYRLPRFAVNMLLRRQVRQGRRNAYDVVFPSASGTLRDPNNYRKQWRAARAGIGFEWVTPHTFRKSVGTIVANAEGLTAASHQLGHSSESVTSKHYVQRRDLAPDRAELLEAFGDAPV